MCVKAVGIALKLSFEGMNQFIYFQTWIFTLILVFCCILQINYLNKVFLSFQVFKGILFLRMLSLHFFFSSNLLSFVMKIGKRIKIKDRDVSVF